MLTNGMAPPPLGGREKPAHTITRPPDRQPDARTALAGHRSATGATMGVSWPRWRWGGSGRDGWPAKGGRHADVHDPREVHRARRPEHQGHPEAGGGVSPGVREAERTGEGRLPDDGTLRSRGHRGRAGRGHDERAPL